MLAEISTSCLAPGPLPWSELPWESRGLDPGTALLPSLGTPRVTGQPQPGSPGGQPRAWGAPGHLQGCTDTQGLSFCTVALIKGRVTLITDRWQLNLQLWHSAKLPLELAPSPELPKALELSGDVWQGGSCPRAAPSSSLGSGGPVQSEGTKPLGHLPQATRARQLLFPPPLPTLCQTLGEPSTSQLWRCGGIVPTGLRGAQHQHGQGQSSTSS